MKMAQPTFVIVLAVLVMELIVVESAFRRMWKSRLPMSRVFQYQRDIRSDEPFLFDKLLHPGIFGSEYGFDAKRFSVDNNKQWFEGPNVCHSRTEDPKSETESQNEIGFLYRIRSCIVSDTAYKCIWWSGISKRAKTLTNVYECCPGFSRKPIDYGCPTAKKLQDFVSTARELNLTELARAIEEVDLVPMLTEANKTFTIFGPTDEAFQKIKSLPLSENEVPLQANRSVVIVSKQATDALLQDTKNLIMGHVALVKLTSPHLKNNQLIETASPFQSKIRVNLYNSPQHVMTANCKRVMTVDSMALNGVIHVVEEIFQPVTDSLMEKISRNPDFSYFTTVVDRTGLGQMLSEDGDLTVFAPTDSAFRKMDPNLYNKLLSEPTCLTKFVKNHVLPSVVCSAVIPGQTRAKNAIGSNIKLTRVDNKLYVNGVQVISADNMATNGVLYIIEDVHLMGDAQNVLIVAEKSGFTKFLDLIDRAGLRKTVENLENVTIFVPNNEALDKASLSDLANDLEKLQAVLKYHIVQNEFNRMGLYNNRQLDTLHAGEKIRINQYSLLPHMDRRSLAAQCAKIVKTNIKSCNAIIHVVDKVLTPPIGNVVDVLAMDSRFSTFVDLLKKAKLIGLLQQPGPFTVFAPTDTVFKALGSDAVLELQGNKDLLMKLLKNHIGEETICCSGIFRYQTRTSKNFRTLSEKVFNLDRTESGQPTIRYAKVTECDKTGTNGVVHVIDRVLMN